MDQLASAAARGDTQTVRLLLQTAVDVNGTNAFGRTPLQVMMMGSTPVAQLLLESGAEPNVSDQSTGATPLHDACRTGFLATAELLLQAGADPQALDHGLSRPLDLAKKHRHWDIVAFLESLEEKN